MGMTRCVTAAEMKKIEESAMSSLFGISAQILMSLAGKAIAVDVIKRFCPGDTITVVCGSGNNGGDGYAAAAFLSAAGYTCTVWQAEPGKKRITPESAFFLSLCVNRHLLTSIQPDFKESKCIIDCLTGIGLRGAVKPEYARIISEINSSGSFVVSADIPSGLRADGSIAPMQSVVHADVTVTMGMPKINCIQYPGRIHTGTLITADIGLPCDMAKAHDGHATFIMDKDSFKKIQFNDSSFDVHKYDNGHLAIIGGFKGMEGAAILAADAAFSTGAGLVTIYSEVSSRSVIAGKIPEAMTTALSATASDENLRSFFKEEFEKKKIKALLIGCGMGRELFQERVFHAALESAEGIVSRMIFDGDALWFLARSDIHPKRNGSELILTPHIGECSRLLDREAAQIENDIYGSAIELSSRFDCTAVVKGATTVTAGNERCFINMSGNPALATAGSGDVLAGICGALQMRKMPPDIAGAASAYIHGAAADLIIKRTGASIIRASEIKNEIRTIVHSDHV
jgi:NAD(P)H-hydrate epimerase